MNLESNKPVFLVVTSKQCPHCTTFKTNHGKQLENRLRQMGRVRYIKLETPTNSIAGFSEFRGTNGEPIPYGIRTYINGFPTFLMFTPDSWNATILNKSSPLIGEDYLDTHNLTADSISSWVDNTSRKQEYVSSSSSSSVYHSADNSGKKQNKFNYSQDNMGTPIFVPNNIKNDLFNIGSKKYQTRK